MQAALTRAHVEDFLFQEAELLDDWRLDEWTGLFTEDSLYEVTSPGSPDPRHDNAAHTLFLISDHIGRLRGRATRLGKRTAHAEYPHSKTRHIVGNIRHRAEADGHTAVRANFAVYRTREDVTTIYVGEYNYQLTATDGEIRIRSKRASLDLDSLYEQGRLTIIL